MENNLLNFFLSILIVSEIALNESLHLISMADTNHDNKLSIDEIVDNHDVFVGSEATDFGQQLHTHVNDEL